MIGEKIGESSGKVTNRRVLSNPDGGPKVETSFQTKGYLLGVEIRENGTYTADVRPDGTLFGNGQGVILGKDGDMVSWVGNGVGTFKGGGAVSYRGAVYYRSASPKFARLNTVAAVFESEVDAEGNTRAELWEWK